MCFSTFTQSIWIDYLENITKQQEKKEAQYKSAGPYSHSTLRNFFDGNRFQQLEVACARRMSAYTQPTIPAICKPNFFSAKAVILISFWYFVNKAYSRTSEQLSSSFNWPDIIFWPNVEEAVILIRATRKWIFSVLETIFSCHNKLFLQPIIGCKLLLKLARKVA